MRIAIDIDSTLHHYWDQLQAVAKRRFGVDLPYEHQHTWGISQLRPEQVKCCVEETHRERHVLAAEPYEGAVEAVRAWHEAGHFIHITSHRSTDAQVVTERWLDAIGLPYDEVYLSYDKVTRCREIGIEVLVDDSPVNLERAMAEGIVPATILHPWNRELCALEDVVHAEDWAGLEAVLAPVLTGGRTPA